MTERAPSRRPMMFSRLASAVHRRVGAGLAAEAHAALAPRVPRRRVAAHRPGRQAELRGAARAAVAATGQPVAAQRAQCRHPRRDAQQLDSARPSTRQRPCTDSAVRPGETSANGAAELQRVPGRAQAAQPGAWPLADPARRGAQAHRQRPKPGLTLHAAAPLRQQAWRARSSRPRPRRPSVHSSRPGSDWRRGCPGRRSAPPRRCRTTPCRAHRPAAGAGRSRKRRRAASQAAGANATNADQRAETMPHERPAQRCAARLVPGDFGEGRFAPAGTGHGGSPAARLRRLQYHGVPRSLTVTLPL